LCSLGVVVRREVADHGAIQPEMLRAPGRSLQAGQMACVTLSKRLCRVIGRAQVDGDSRQVLRHGIAPVPFL
jgi:hypothetical protein